jgi:hypothetical protein
MDNLERLNTLCPVCDGPVSFEAHRLGELVPCPHCEETIVLGAVESLSVEQDAPSETVYEEQSGQNKLKLLAAAVAIIVLLSGGVFWYRKGTVVQPPAKSNSIEVAATADETPPVQPPVSVPTPPPAVVTPPAPNQDEVLIALTRQRQEEAYQQQVIAEMRRANDIAEANARWQQWNEMQSQLRADSEPSEAIPPGEVIEPAPALPEIEIIQAPIGGVYFGGGMRTGSPIVRNLPGTVGQPRGFTTVFVNRVRSAPYVN